MPTGYPTFTMTARVVRRDGVPPNQGDTFEFWIPVAVGYVNPEAASTPILRTTGTTPITIVGDAAALATPAGNSQITLPNSSTGMYQSAVVAVVCRPYQGFTTTLEIGGNITVTETGEVIPYTVRLFRNYTGDQNSYFNLVLFRLRPDNKFPTSFSDATGVAKVWTHGRFMQRYLDRIDSIDPNPPSRPSMIQVIQNGNPGDLDCTSWEVFYEVLHRLGATTTQRHTQQWVPATLSRQYFKRFSIGIYHPPGYMYPYGPGNPGGASPEVPDAAGIAAWAQSQVTSFLAAGYASASQITHIKIADEPSYPLPPVLTAFNNTYVPGSSYIRDEATRLAYLQNFRDYLAAQAGVTPGLLGVASYASITTLYGPSKELSATLADRVRFYWSIRWLSYLSSKLYADCADALKVVIPGIRPTLSLNFYSGRMWQTPVTSSPATAEDGVIGFDWHEIGRLGGLIGVDDYITEFVISNNALRTASCVRHHPTGKMFSNEVVINSGENESSLVGAIPKKVFVNTGRGSDRMQMYLWGPATINKDGGGAEAMMWGAPMVADYQRISRWLHDTEAEHLAGSPPWPEVAVVAPRSAQMFNGGTRNVSDVTQGNWWLSSTDHFVEALSLLTTLTHAGIESHWMDEDDLGSAIELARYKVIYLTTPNVPAEYNATISTWVTNGGTLVTFPGAGTYDRYNTPTPGGTGVPGIGGIGEAARTRQEQNNLVSTPTGFSVTGTPDSYGIFIQASEAWRTVVTANGGTVEATFTDNGNPAVVNKAVGSGRRIHFAWFVAQSYVRTGIGSGGSQRPPTAGWDPSLRAFVVRPVTLAEVVLPMTLSKAVVEGLVLKSPTTALLTLLNWRAEPVTVSGTLRCDFTPTRLLARSGPVPFSYASGVVTWGPLLVDDAEILVARGDSDPAPTQRSSKLTTLLGGRV